MSGVTRFTFAAFLSAATITLHAETPSNSVTGNFAVDMPKLIKASVAKALHNHRELQYENLALEQENIYFRCNTEPHWRFVDTFTLEVPDQSGPASLCEARIELIIKDTLKVDSKPAEGWSDYCFDTADYESITVTVYGSGVIEADRGTGGGGRTVPCDENRIFLSVDEAIAQYESPGKADEDSTPSE